jgi:antitoxin (DNA-binding transcriptional repressor) of toxin-antitoxin stability system
MRETIPIEQASSRLSELIHSLGPSDEIVLTENEQPVARLLLPSKMKGVARVPGLAKGMLTTLSEDDDHLADFSEYMP